MIVCICRRRASQGDLGRDGRDEGDSNAPLASTFHAVYTVFVAGE